MKKIKRKLKIAGRFLWLFVSAPLYVISPKYRRPRFSMVLVSLLTWWCLFRHVVGLASGEGNDPGNAILIKYFAVGAIILDVFYLQASLRNLWAVEEIKKFVLGEADDQTPDVCQHPELKSVGGTVKENTNEKPPYVWGHYLQLLTKLFCYGMKLGCFRVKLTTRKEEGYAIRRCGSLQ